MATYGEIMRKVYGKVVDNKLVIGNEKLEIGFDKSGRLIRILNKQSKKEYISDRYVKLVGGGPIFCLTFLDDLTPKTVYPTKLEGYTFKNYQSQAELILRYNINKVNIECSILIKNESELTLWNINIENNSKKRIVEITYPLLLGIRIGEKYSDDILVRPNRYGEKICNPFEKTFDPIIRYLGSASMMWMDLYDPSGGLYLASYDKTLIMTDLEVKKIYHGINALIFSLKKYIYISVGEKWESEPYAVGIHLGDWHWAADRYRNWAKTWMKKPRPPKWLVECNGFLEIVKKRFGEMPNLYRLARQLGINYLSIAGQMIGEGCCNRFYYPDPMLGSINELKKSINKIHKEGGHLTFYINGQALNPRYPSLPKKYRRKIPKNILIPNWETEYKDYAIIRYDGSYVGQYPIDQFPFIDGSEKQFDYPYAYYIMCPASKGWQNYLKYWALKYVKEYGADGIMIDQIGADEPKYCFNFKHNHKHHGIWVQGYCQLLKEILEEGRKINKDFCLGWIEGCGDAYGQYVASHLTHGESHVVLFEKWGSNASGLWAKYPYPEVFRYTFPEYIVFGGGSIKGLENRKRVLNRIFLMGEKINVYYEEIIESPVYSEYTRDVINLMNKIKSWLHFSIFKDTIRLRKIPSNVEAKIFERIDNRGILVTLLDDRPEKTPFNLKIDLKNYNYKDIDVILYTLKDRIKRLKYRIVKNNILSVKVEYPQDFQDSSIISAITISF